MQCAVRFIFHPELFSPGFELSGMPGAAAVRGMGVLFLMWNVPYIVALIHPRRHRISLYEAIAMQAIGLAGETLILRSLPETHPVARQSVMCFILFDAGGLAALCLAAWITRR
jgi:hypothetical protein